MKKPSIDAEVFGDETHLAGGVIVVVTLVGIAMAVEVGDEGFCQRVVEHRLAALSHVDNWLHKYLSWLSSLQKYGCIIYSYIVISAEPRHR